MTGEKGHVMTLEEQVAYHLEYILTVPVPLYMVEPCVAAIKAVTDHDLDRVIDLPEKCHTVDENGNTYTTAYAWEIMYRFHLDGFLPKDWKAKG